MLGDPDGGKHFSRTLESQETLRYSGDASASNISLVKRKEYYGRVANEAACTGSHGANDQLPDWDTLVAIEVTMTRKTSGLLNREHKMPIMASSKEVY